MGNKIFCFIFLLSIPFLAGAESIKQFALDEYSIFKLKVHYDKGVTTVMFPSALSAIYGSNVVTSTDNPGDFLLSYQPGTYFFSVRALRKGAEGSLNVIYNRKTYVLHLKEDADPYSSVTFFSDSKIGRSKTCRITPSILLSLLDKAKSYQLLKKHHPENTDGIMYLKSNIRTVYDGFSITVDEIFRFDKEDTIVFRILIKNTSGKIISYDPRMLAAGLGETVYYASITDASGLVPANSEIPAYFAITGTPTGGRNNLSPDNRWKIILSPNDDLKNKEEETGND